MGVTRVLLTPHWAATSSSSTGGRETCGSSHSRCPVLHCPLLLSALDAATRDLGQSWLHPGRSAAYAEWGLTRRRISRPGHSCVESTLHPLPNGKLFPTQQFTSSLSRGWGRMNPFNSW